MTKKSIDPFDQFYCMSAHDPRMSFVVREIYKTYGDKTCVGRKSLHKFGSNDSISTTLSPVNSWGAAEEYQTSNVTLNLSSSSVLDTGMVTVEYMYFDENNDLQFAVQQATLSGQTPVALPSAGCRWTRMTTNLNNTGDVYIYRGASLLGVPVVLGNTHCQIPAGTSQSQKAATSVASGNYLVLTQIWSDVIRNSSAAVVTQFKVRQLGDDFRVAPRRGATSGDHMAYDLDPYLIIPPNSDIEVYAASASGSDRDVTAGFNGYFADIISS